MHKLLIVLFSLFAHTTYAEEFQSYVPSGPLVEEATFTFQPEGFRRRVQKIQIDSRNFEVDLANDRTT